MQFPALLPALVGTDIPVNMDDCRHLIFRAKHSIEVFGGYQALQVRRCPVLVKWLRFLRIVFTSVPSKTPRIRPKSGGSRRVRL